MVSNNEHNPRRHVRQRGEQMQSMNFLEERIGSTARVPAALTTMGLGHIATYLEAHSEDLATALAHSDWSIRAAAVQVLGRQEKRVPIELLLHALHDEHEAVRAAAVRSLSLQGKRTPVQPLVEALQDPQWRVRTAAALALGHLSKRTPIKPLISVLHDEYADVRAAAIWALGTLGTRTPIEHLVTALHDKDWSVREAAVMALKEQGERAPTAQLLAAHWDEDNNVRYAAESAYEGGYTEQSGQKLNIQSTVQTPSPWLRLVLAVASVAALSPLSTIITNSEYVGRFAMIIQLVAIGVVCLAILLINVIYQRKRPKALPEQKRSQSGLNSILISWHGIVLAVISVIVLIVTTPSLLATFFVYNTNMTTEIVHFILICRLISLGGLALTIVAINALFHRKL